MRDALSNAGYAPLVTRTPQDLPRIVRTERPRPVLLDLLLPDGEVICAELTAAGVPDKYAFGEDLHLCTERLCSAYLPTVRILNLLL